MKPVILSPFGEHPFVKTIANKQQYEIGDVTLHDFPDGETYVKFQTALQNREVIILNSLERPNSKILPLLFIAETAKELGAKRVGWCAPYLPYLRQDKRFKSGEGVTSKYFAKLISHYFDWLITVDPHLHRYHHLNEIYSIPTTVLHAAPQIAQWIAKTIENPVLIGPDMESEQWVREVAESAHAPYFILEKKRFSDREVEIALPEIKSYLNHTPVLIDDIISTAHTMIETTKQLKLAQMKPPVCIAVHAIFADNAYASLLAAGAERVVTCNTITHSSNQIDLSTIINEAIQQRFRRNRS